MTRRVSRALRGAISLLSIVTLRQDVAGSADPDTLITVGRSLVAVHDWSFLLGPGVIPAVNALFLATLMYRSGLVPRWIPTFGLVGAPLLIVSAFGVAFDGWEQLSNLSCSSRSPSPSGSSPSAYT